MSEQKQDYSTRTKTIFRVEKNKDNPFVMIDRRPIENPSLSWRAKGVLTYLISRPDNWIVRLGDLVKRSPEGVYAVRAALKELTKAGHITRREEREENGRFKQYVLEVREIPVVITSPPTNLPQAAEPQAVDLTLNDTDPPNDTDLKDINTGAGAPNVPTSFGVDWQIAGGNETVIIPEEADTFTNDANNWAALIAMNNADLESLAFEFMISAHKLPADSDIKFWRKVFRKFRKMTPPATADHIRQAVIKHTAARLAIKSPGSIEWAVIEIINPTPQIEAEPKAYDGIRQFLAEQGMNNG
jgi:hypothetical protein